MGQLEAAQKRIEELEQEVEALKSANSDIEFYKSLSERLELALQSANIGVWEWNVETKEVVWDDSMYALYGFAEHEKPATFEKWLSRLPEVDRDRAMAETESAINHHRQFNSRFRIYSDASHQKMRHIRVIARCHYDEEGKPLKMVGINWDITESAESERRNAELQEQLQQSQKLEAVGTLAGGIAHDFNNMLGAIIGYIDLAKRTLKGEPSNVMQMLDKSLSASFRARELVSQMLVYSRQGESPQVVMNVRETVAETVDFLRASLPTTINLEHDLKDVGYIEANPTQMNQIIMNLATNASQALPDGKGHISIRLEHFAFEQNDESLGLLQGEFAMISVEDDGLGIPQEVQERIFEPFYTTKGVSEGTGLGLSVVQGIVKSHHGSIQVESEPGHGSKFTIFWPLVDAPEAPEETAGNQEVAAGSGQHILVIDDEQALLSMTELLLTTSGYEVTCFNSSIMAQEYLEENLDKIDLVITDQIMPDITGSELLEYIRSRGDSTPVIITTGYGFKMDPEKVSSLGHVRILKKPCSLNDILNAIGDGINN